MKIYTKSGDKGETSLLGGNRVKKYDLRINSYGTVDELNSWIGLLRDQKIDKTYVSFLLEIQDKLFTIGSHLASLGNKSQQFTIPEINASAVTLIETNIDDFKAKCLTKLEDKVVNFANYLANTW